MCEESIVVGVVVKHLETAVALDGIDFTVGLRTVSAVPGPNCAEKTASVDRPRAGRMRCKSFSRGAQPS